ALPSSDEATDMPSGEVEDTRRPAYGPGRVLIFIYGIFALSATARASVQLIRDAAEAPVAYSLSALSAVVYIVATIAIAHNGRRMRRLAWVTVTFELVGVLPVGVLCLTHPGLFAHPSVWSGFGVGYGYVPAVLPVLGLFWMWRSSPARIAAASAGGSAASLGRGLIWSGRRSAPPNRFAGGAPGGTRPGTARTHR